MQSLRTRVDLVFTDASGSTAEIKTWAKDGLTVAEIDSGLSLLISAASALSDAQITKQRIVYRRENELYDGNHTTGDNKRTGVFIYNTSDNEEYALIELPSLNETLLMATGNGEGVLIDLSISEVTAFIDLLIESGVTNPFAVEITSLLAAYRQSRV